MGGGGGGAWGPRWLMDYIPFIQYSKLLFILVIPIFGVHLGFFFFSILHLTHSRP